MLEVNTDIWGKKLWYIIHYLANKFDNIYIEDFQLFFFSLKYLIPCPVCKTHYTDMINTDYKINFKNKDECVTWAFNIHNVINKRIGNNIYYKEIVNNYNSDDTFYKYLFDIIQIFLNHDANCFSKFKYLFKIVCHTNEKFNSIKDKIPHFFLKEDKIYKWINDFNRILFS
jgi:hypothetical protein